MTHEEIEASIREKMPVLRVTWHDDICMAVLDMRNVAGEHLTVSALFPGGRSDSWAVKQIETMRSTAGHVPVSMANGHANGVAT